MRTYICAECGKEFQATQQAKYCSPACKRVHQNKATSTQPCVVCGKMFVALKSSHARFCSNACVQAAQKEVKENPDSPLAKIIKPRKEPETVTRICIDCGKHFETKNASMVNRRCDACLKEYKRLWSLGAGELLAEINSKHYTDRELAPMIDAVLKNAGVVVETPPPQPAKSIAQSPTHTVNMTREEHNAQRRARRAIRKALGKLAGETHDRTGYRWGALSRLGAVCSCCGYDLYEDALQVHHIDMNRENNSKENLTVLCSNCHSVLHKRIKQKMSLWEDKIAGIKNELEILRAEVKERNQAGKPDMVTRTEGSEESESGATHSDTSSSDMSHHEAAPEADSWDVQPDLGF